MNNHSSPNSVAARFPLYGICDWCNARAKPGDGRDKIKKCGGCSVALYCSRKCQSEAWPTHRLACHSYVELKEQAAVPDYSALSIPTLVKRWARWADIHVWSLRTIVEAVAHQTDGGVDAHLENQRVVAFMMSLRQPNNPSEAFHIDRVSIVGKEEDFVQVQWESIESACSSTAESMRAKLTEAEQRVFAGIIPTLFVFKMVGWFSFHPYPLYRLRAHGGGPSYKYSCTREEKMLFGDVEQLCVGGINHGLVLRAPGGDYNQALPDAGFYMQLSRSWIWVPASTWDWERVDITGPVPYKSAAEMLRRYHELLVQRNFADHANSADARCM
ncbi:hypothetical protein V8D89_005586 [Ganoderma adspersum]